jgi:response regulator RpfG family c-di-GMP phosphodiesterase
MHSVLVVDDEAAIRTLVARWLQSSGYLVRLAGSAEHALAEMGRDPATVALLDVNMPGRDGLWLAGELRRQYPETAVVMASGAREFGAAVTSLRHGAVDFLLKPLGRDPLCEAVARGIDWHVEAVAVRAQRDELELELRSRMAQVSNALSAVSIASAVSLEAVFRLVTIQDAGAFGHGHRVRDLSMRIASQLGLAEPHVAQIARGALLHDLGELLIPHSIMHKATPLTQAEEEIVRRHPRMGHDLIKDIPFLATAAEVVLGSHERFDGTGYPDRRSGAQISLASRIVACADAFDAMTCRDTYRARLGSRDALVEIDAGRGTQFDPLVVDALLATFGHEPEGPTVPAGTGSQVPH